MTIILPFTSTFRWCLFKDRATMSRPWTRGLCPRMPICHCARMYYRMILHSTTRRRRLSHRRLTRRLLTNQGRPNSAFGCVTYWENVHKLDKPIPILEDPDRWCRVRMASPMILDECAMLEQPSSKKKPYGLDKGPDSRVAHAACSQGWRTSALKRQVFMEVNGVMKESRRHSWDGSY